ncbi:MAG: leucine-rich repeat protein [Clostridia bacterium]|nr:leucine-rich repeat protein [Clostridia bacterium]
MKKLFYFALITLFSLCVVFALFSCDRNELPSDGPEICLDGTHEFLAWEIEKEAVCNSKGIRSRTCVVCKQYTEKQYFTNPTNHNFVDFVCTYCGKMDAPENVGFVLSEDKTYYTLYSIEDESATEFTIPPRYEGLPVKVIAKGAFEKCVSMETISVPSSVEIIEEGAFKGCYSLKKITLPFIGETRNEKNSVFGHIFGSESFKGSVGIYQYPNEKETEYWIPANLVDVTITDGSLYEGCFENCTRIKRIEYQGNSKNVWDRAFNGCYSLTTITLSETIEKYGDKAFQNCSALDTYPLDNIKEIGDYCFAGCSFEYLSTPSSLTYVGEGAFAACPNLKTAHISSSLSRLSDNMFNDCALLEKVEIEEKVKSIGDGCFGGCGNLSEVTMPSTIEEIKPLAFKDCVSLKSIVIPSKVELIDKGAFQGCSGLENVTIENGVVELGELCFSGCSKIEEINIPASLKEIGKNVFADCSSLKKININNNNTSFRDIDGNIYNSILTTLILYSPGNNQASFVIPEGVTSIDSSAFQNATALNEVVFPSTMKKIPKFLFAQNNTLRSIVINEGCEMIEKGAFQGCTALNSVTINGVSIIGEEAFTQCKSLKTVVIDGVSTISKGAFHSCPLLNSVSITNVTLVGENAFAKCQSLKEITFGKGTEITVGTEAFSDCVGLENLTIGSSVLALGEFAFSNCTSLKKVNIERGVANIGEACFRNCSSLEYIYIPSSLVSVNAYAFEGCTSLASFDVSSVSTNFKVIDGHLVDRNNTLVVFAPNKFAEEITIPNGITKIGKFVFRNALTIKKVNLPSSLEVIGEEAFFNSGLSEINLNKVTTIEDYAFGSCLSLTSILLPVSVTTLGDYVFQYSHNLEEVYINDTLVNVGMGVFHAKADIEDENETFVYIEFTDIPDTWSKSWDSTSNIIYILGRYVKDN